MCILLGDRDLGERCFVDKQGDSWMQNRIHCSVIGFTEKIGITAAPANIFAYIVFVLQNRARSLAYHMADRSDVL